MDPSAARRGFGSLASAPEPSEPPAALGEFHARREDGQHLLPMRLAPLQLALRFVPAAILVPVGVAPAQIGIEPAGGDSARSELAPFGWRDYAPGVRIVNEHMGVVVTMAGGLRGQHTARNYGISLFAGSTFRGIVWCMAGVEEAAITTWLRGDGPPLELLPGSPPGVRVIRTAAEQSQYTGWKLGPNHNAIVVWMSSAPAEEAQTRRVVETMVEGAELMQPRGNATGIYGNLFYNYLSGCRLSQYRTVTDYGGGGYADKWLVELGPNGLYTHAASTSLGWSGPAVGSIAQLGAAAGRWSVHAMTATRAELRLVDNTGHLVSHVVDIDAQSGRTTIDGTRTFRVVSEACPMPADGVVPLTPQMAALVTAQRERQPAASADARSAAIPQHPTSPTSPTSRDLPAGRELDGTWISGDHRYDFRGNGVTFLVREAGGEFEVCSKGTWSAKGGEIVFHFAADGEDDEAYDEQFTFVWSVRRESFILSAAGTDRTFKRE